MDVIKMEREIDPLAIEGNNNTDTEELKTLSEEGNRLDLLMTGIKTECMDHNYDVKTEMTFDKSLVSSNFPVLKSEVEEENVLDPHMTEIKSECMDHSYDVKSEMTFDESPVPIDFPIVKNKDEIIFYRTTHMCQTKCRTRSNWD
ncbi:uncharacterized protein [Periplaneta americana]|uniref:uncharacterized protein isoform X3 n=1 Tax=Periplaneta americana TaxID=6978 RepID=UPI0037E8F262